MHARREQARHTNWLDLAPFGACLVGVEVGEEVRVGVGWRYGGGVELGLGLHGGRGLWGVGGG